MPHKGQNDSPLYLATVKKDNFKNLCTFGCRVYVQPLGVQKKHFKEDARQGIFLGYIPHTDCLILYYNEGSCQLKISTHAKFDEGFNDLPVDNLPLNSQQILCLNSTCVPADTKELDSSDLEFFHPFSYKETAFIPVLPNTTNFLFGFDLVDCDISGHTYIKDVNNTKSSSTATSFGTCKQSRKKLCCSFITHIDGDPVISNT